MKKIIVGLALLVLVGAGCAKTPAENTDNKATAPEMTGSIEVINEDGTKSQLQIEQTPKQEYDEDGVPIIDIQLGGEEK